MASLIDGYSYDIFISYRQKDNKGDHWVTEFVRALQIELESTFKEEISIYFDENVVDGLHEGHDVDESLKEKIRVLVFIPVISRTYCDPSSFAWQNEFLKFKDFARSDHFSLKLKVAHGNVHSRILPVRIHDLDEADVSLFEKESGAILRPIDFTFRSTGVNRPLRPSDDARTDNANHTFYGDQINKLANSIREIISAIKHQQQFGIPETIKSPDLASAVQPNPKNTKTKKFAIGSLMVAILLLAAFLTYSVKNDGLLSDEATLNEKSIAVLPFVDMSPAHDQGYLSDGMMDEILNHLFKLGDLRVISRTSAMQFRDTKLLIPQIAEQLGVTYILEGSVQMIDEQLRIRIQLINGKTDEHLWAETYERAFKDVFAIQSDVAKQVAQVLRVRISPKVEKELEVLPTTNMDAYTLFLKAGHVGYSTRQEMLEQAIDLDPNFAEAYVALALDWIYSGGHAGSHTADEVRAHAIPLLGKAESMKKDMTALHGARGLLYLFYDLDFKKVEAEFQWTRENDPEPERLTWFTDYLLASGQTSEAFKLCTEMMAKENRLFRVWPSLAMSQFYSGDPENAAATMRTALDRFPNDRLIILNLVRVLTYANKYDEALQVVEKNYPRMTDEDVYDESNFSCHLLSYQSICHHKLGNPDESRKYLDMLKKRSDYSPIGSPSFFVAGVYSEMKEYDLAIKYLEKAYSTSEVELYWTKVEPMFRPIHNEPGFKAFVKKVFKE
jgi:TolB-like protein